MCVHAEVMTLEWLFELGVRIAFSVDICLTLSPSIGANNGAREAESGSLDPGERPVSEYHDSEQRTGGAKTL